MNVKLQLSMSFLKSVIIFGGILIFAFPAIAGVSSFYKWKDDQGKVHFTDNPLKIPEKYRSPSTVEKRRGLPPAKSNPGNGPSGTGKTGNTEASEDVPKTSEPGAEKPVMEEALSFLKSDIQRFQKYEDYVPQRRHAVLLRNEIVEVLPAKEALEKKLEKFDSPLSNNIRSFLKKSLQKDYEAKKRENPRRLIFVKERSRINGELSEKIQLVEKLEAELASLPDKDPVQTNRLPSEIGRNNTTIEKPEPESRETGRRGVGNY
ncbi:MAG: hypothetical protein NPINA01_21280 [Nitrospinaceae bacterium]|nr:MAG: hypothetical protein NPINA01_21280 [Nitrospinaceae bacterium]